MFRSEDIGVTWTRINDSTHQFGGPGNAQLIDGDMNVFGRVFMSSVGRGVVYGDLVSSPVQAKRISMVNKLEAASYQVFDLMGRAQFTTMERPVRLPAGQWIIVALSKTGAQLGSWTVTGR